MRDALLIAVIVAGLFAALRYPFAGMLVWAWFSLMTPHQMAYGAFGVPLNLVIAAVTIAALLIRGEILRMQFDAVTFWLAMVACWLFISQAASLDPANSALYFDRFIKTLVFAILCAKTANTRLRINAMTWTLVLSIGFFAAKGALFTLATFGRYRVQGVEQTILEDNNHMGIAIATILPLILYLRGEAARPYLRAALTLLFVASIISIVGTQSRGAFICLIVFAGFFWLRARRKFAILAASSAIAVAAVFLMPAQWTERMGTIAEASEDSSFMGRVDAWIINWKFALENPLTGAGLRNPYQPDLASRIDPVRAPRAKAAHSIYFEMLGGAGFVGLFFYLAALAAAFAKTASLHRVKDAAGARDWRAQFGYFAQISLAVFCVGGASTSLEMWDGYLIVMALIAGAAAMVRPGAEEIKYRNETRRSTWRGVARGVGRGAASD
ncbi:MAG: putative O-glycosylation ligase, exosortase A system-associated [Parvularculaceae bacterium]|nr:putative O-glycosylation ligase, exosortase A system-associated [Parvularculaceae bacterium]